MIVGGYSLDLYCKYDSASAGTANPDMHREQRSFEQFYAQTFGQCKAQSKNAGWKWIDKDVVCKSCYNQGLR